MDRQGANYKKVCKQIFKKFNIIVLKLHIPIFNKKNYKFESIIDIINEKEIS